MQDEEASRMGSRARGREGGAEPPTLGSLAGDSCRGGWSDQKEGGQRGSAEIQVWWGLSRLRGGQTRMVTCKEARPLPRDEVGWAKPLWQDKDGGG